MYLINNIKSGTDIAKIIQYILNFLNKRTNCSDLHFEIMEVRRLRVYQNYLIMNYNLEKESINGF